VGRQSVKITADTNVLVRAITGDDPVQSAIARTELANAELVALGLPSLCELVWVLARGYKIPRSDIAETLRRLIAAENVAVNRPAVEAGLAVWEAGGDFADGVIAHEGTHLGAEAFVSFDRQAVNVLRGQGESARLLG
jgi:predicted nucleic-acid-binding protein